MGSVEKKSILFTLGTRPEAIKLVPVIRAFQLDPAFDTRICITAQHRELLDGVLDFFDLRPDVDLDMMRPGQSLATLTSRIVAACEEVFASLQPDMMFVQGDTTSAFAAAMAASQCRIPVAHVEAGLRSHRKSSPFPEEINRVMIGHLADLHFAPGKTAVENLRREGITQGVHAVGNSVVDTLQLACRLLAQERASPRIVQTLGLKPGRKLVLVTLHRRESFGQPLEDICSAVRAVAERNADVEIVCPVHPNPNVSLPIHRILLGLRNVHLLEPLGYADFVALLCRASLVISDSGGVLEEAETLGLPVLVVREVTERVEALASGNARLVGSDKRRIFAEATALLSLAPAVSSPSSLRHTFGDGQAAARILRLTREYFVARSGMDHAVPLTLPTAA